MRDGLEDGGGDVGVGGALVEQGLHVGLGEDATARRDRVELGVVLRERIEARGVGVQEGGHLVDERAGPAGAGAVHALLGRGLEVGDLGVLAAELDHDVGLRVRALHGLRGGDHLLDELDVHDLRDLQAARAGDGGDQGVVGVGAFDVLEEASHLPSHVGVVAAIV